RTSSGREAREPSLAAQSRPRALLAGRPAEEPALERPEHLLADERLHVHGVAVALEDAHVVLEHIVRALERVVELVPLEDVVVRPRRIGRSQMRIDRAPDRPDRSFLALDPD